MPGPAAVVSIKRDALTGKARAVTGTNGNFFLPLWANQDLDSPAAEMQCNAKNGL